jgi:hypothetical protein
MDSSRQATKTLRGLALYKRKHASIDGWRVSRKASNQPLRQHRLSISKPYPRQTRIHSSGNRKKPTSCGVVSVSLAALCGRSPYVLSENGDKSLASARTHCITFSFSDSGSSHLPDTSHFRVCCHVFGATKSFGCKTFDSIQKG